MKFLQKMPLYFFYTMVQKSQKWPKTQIKGGPALAPLFRFFFCLIIIIINIWFTRMTR